MSRVPAALHAELTECAQLVRVLRTNRTLDLTAHLLRHTTDDNTWTAWPLIDCPVPEWTLHDEIQQLADAVVKPEEDDDTDLHGLVANAGAVLVHILNLMADQRPSAPGSMQNRLSPMNWEDVISLLAVARLIDPAVVARAEKRLERIYGPSSTQAVARVESVRARCAALMSVPEDQLFAPPVLHPRTRRNDVQGRRSHKSVAKSRAVVDTDSDADPGQ